MFINEAVNIVSCKLSFLETWKGSKWWKMDFYKGVLFEGVTWWMRDLEMAAFVDGPFQMFVSVNHVVAILERSDAL